MKKLVLTLFLAFPTLLFSQYQLPDITLYSQFSPEDSLTTPTSINTVGSNHIKNSKSLELSELTSAIPNVNYASGSSVAKYFQIRGIGERSLYEGVPNQSVGIYIDQIDLGALGSSYPLFDLQQVEVTKGPNATRFGANAMAGNINQFSRSAGDTATNVGIEYQSYNTTKVDLATGGKLFGHEKLLFRIATMGLKSDGIINNTYQDRDDSAKKDEWAGRIKIDFAGNRYQNQLTLTSYRQRNGYDNWNFDSDLTSISDHPGVDNQDLDATSLSQTFQIDSEHQFAATTNYGKSKETLSYDEDWGNNIYWNNLAGYNDDYNYFAQNFRKKENLSQEIRLDGNSWNVGIYLQHFTEDSQNKSFKNDAERLTKRIEGDFDKKVASLFGKKNISITDNFALTLGARLERSAMDYRDNFSQHFNPKDQYLGGELTLEYLGLSDQLLYSTLSRGYKHGGFNITTGLDESKRYYRPEYLYNLELGHKMRSGRLTLESSIFSSYLTDAQINTTSQDNPGDPNDFTYYIGNAAKSLHLGMENSAKLELNSKWSFSSSLGLLKAKYLEYSYEAKDLSQREVAHAPSYQYNLSSTYSPLASIHIISSLEGKDSFYFSNTHDQKSHAFALINLTTQYQLKKMTVEFWIKNILDKRYAERGYYFGNEPPAWENNLYTQSGMPRTIGCGLKGEF